MDDMVATNVKSALYGMQAVAPHFIRALAPGVHVSLVMPGIVVTDFARNAGSAGLRPPPTVTRPGGIDLAPQSVDDVVDVLVRLLDRPAAEAYTNPAQPGVVQRYLADSGPSRPG
jgi:NAD(P)-dependent dehydrogenase (short-subunit alcohol dehydrogenase family)